MEIEGLSAKSMVKLMGQHSGAVLEGQTGKLNLLRKHRVCPSWQQLLQVAIALH